MTKKKRPKATLDRPVHIKFPSSLYNAIKAAADADRRPLTHWIRLQLEKALETDGPRLAVLPKLPPRKC
jgi:hypothetical protein